MIMVDGVVNKTITDLRISYEEPPISMTSQTIRCTMSPRGWEQQETYAEDLVLVLLIEKSDRRESLLNCGALIISISMIYTQRMPNRSCPPLIRTFFADDEASVVLGSYEDIILSETGMHMKKGGA